MLIMDIIGDRHSNF